MTTTNPTDAQMKLARELMTKAAPMFPITTHNGPDYADVTYCVTSALRLRAARAASTGR